MKKLLPFLVFCLLSHMTVAQVVVVLNYMKVPEGGEEEYLAVESEWKMIHQNNVDNGKMLAWELYAVHNQGTASEYNYVTANVYENLQSSLQGFPTEVLEKVWGDKTDEMIARTLDSRDLIYAETLIMQTGIPAEKNEKYLLVNYMKANDLAQYFAMEERAYLPMHRQAIDDNKMAGWSVWSYIFFDDAPYNALTVNGYSSVDQLSEIDYNALFQKSVAEKSPEEIAEITRLTDNTAGLRTILKLQLWESIDKTGPTGG